MRYVVVDAMEFTYPDMMEYNSQSEEIKIESARGSYASFQVLVEGLKVDYVKESWMPEKIYQDDATKERAALGFPRMGGIEAELDCGYPVEFYTLVPVTCEYDVKPIRHRPYYPNRVAPYRAYDCFRPFDGTLDVGVGDGRKPDTTVGGLYCAIKIPQDAEPGTWNGTFKLKVRDEVVEIPCELNVHKAQLPNETLKIIQSLEVDKIALYHNVAQNSDKLKSLEQDYLKLLRKMHQNMMYTTGVSIKTIGENKYEFDFSVLEQNIQKWLDVGMKYFNLPAIGGRRSWKESTIYIGLGLKAMSYEGYCYLSQYLPALHDFLEKKGWLDRVMMGIADEPNDANCTEFRALCGLVRKFVPDIKLMDAMSYGELHGALDIWIPLDAEYDRHMNEIETLRANGDEIWHYVCCCPRGDDYINRFMDYPLLATRYLFWGNYKYNLTGYLHWATNTYQPGQDPFVQNFPMHRNADNICMLPPGDTHLIYPGEDAPWISARFEAQRESAEDYEMLRALGERDKAKADAICDTIFKSFKDVEYNIAEFRKARHQLLDALAEVQR